MAYNNMRGWSSIVVLNDFYMDFIEEHDKFYLAFSFFDLMEYDRAALSVQDCKNKKAYYLHMYGRYLADEKRKLDNAPDSFGKVVNQLFC